MSLPIRGHRARFSFKGTAVKGCWDENVPEEEIYLRVNKDNPASLKVMLKNGGKIHHEDETKYYVRIRKRNN